MTTARKWRWKVVLGLLGAALGCECGGKGPPPPVEQILFGDLHVHSTHSPDAMAQSAPILDGRGLSGPAERCEMARFCARLDFWAITDHPEDAPVELWDDAQRAIRACNDLEGGEGPDPAMVSFLGWEWTQVGESPANDWGHKNVILMETAADRVPARPIEAVSRAGSLSPADVDLAVGFALGLDPDHADVYETMADRLASALDAPVCPDGVSSRELPPGCHEQAADPATLYRKLDEWGFDALVIPHGNAWGAHRRPRASWRPQLDRTQHDPRYQRLVEVYSGHGSMESYRPWRHEADDGTCPPPTADFEPCCHRAGEIVRATAASCQADPASAECLAEVDTARADYLALGHNGADAFPDVPPEAWLDCGQCRDCFQPAFNYRPAFSAQAALAISDLSRPEAPFDYRLGLIGSTDSHRAGPGAGYKERRFASDLFGAAEPDFDLFVDLAAPFVFTEWERQNNYWYSGGLVAAHSLGRSREAIWDALSERRVYATSGERILLWFDLLGEARRPMGSVVTFTGTPAFEVRAVGSFVQAPGCPEDVVARAPAGFIEEACLGECYHPTDSRHLVTRIEVVKIRPQRDPAEDIATLIDDPFLTLPCAPNPDGCTVTFEDPDYGGRAALYYVRAIQAPTPQLNADPLRCTRDASGACTEVDLCRGGHEGAGDDCLSPGEERAWSSPIWLVP